MSYNALEQLKRCLRTFRNALELYRRVITHVIELFIFTLIFLLKEDLNDSAETGERVSQTPLDTFPDIDNYRNILSLTGEAKSRPTLPELQVK